MGGLFIMGPGPAPGPPPNPCAPVAATAANTPATVRIICRILPAFIVFSFPSCEGFLLLASNVIARSRQPSVRPAAPLRWAPHAKHRDQPWRVDPRSPRVVPLAASAAGPLRPRPQSLPALLCGDVHTGR